MFYPSTCLFRPKRLSIESSFFRQVHILFIYFRSHKPEPIDKDVYMVRQYTQTSLGAPKPLSFREATFTSSKDINGLLRQSTNYSMFDVEV